MLFTEYFIRLLDGSILFLPNIYLYLLAAVSAQEHKLVNVNATVVFDSVSGKLKIKYFHFLALVTEQVPSFLLQEFGGKWGI